MEKYFNKEFAISAAIRAIRTMAQTALSFITIGALMSEINWISVASTAVVAGVYSILTSLVTGLPETSVDSVGELTVVEEGEGSHPQILLQLDSEKSLDVIKTKKSVRLDTSKIKL